jgi:hypothetical protein
LLGRAPWSRSSRLLRYTKALDQIKAIKKEMSADIKVDKERLIAFKVDRERAKKVCALSAYYSF